MCTVSHPKPWGPVVEIYAYKKSDMLKKLKMVKPSWKIGVIVKDEFTAPKTDNPQYKKYWEAEKKELKRLCEEQPPVYRK